MDLDTCPIENVELFKLLKFPLSSRFDVFLQKFWDGVHYKVTGTFRPDYLFAPESESIRPT
jgi:hypothetical protein